MTTKYSLIIAIALISAFSIMGVAEAKTIKFSELYKTIDLNGNEKLYIINDDTKPHSITSFDNSSLSFDSGTIYPNSMTGIGLPKNGQYQFYDLNNKTNTGTIRVTTNDDKMPRIESTGIIYKAGDVITIDGQNLPSNLVTNLTIKKPDGTLLHDLSVTSTTEGKISVPIMTSRTSQNGIYKVTSGTASTIFQITGGVTEDNPIDVAPITNSTDPTVEAILVPGQIIDSSSNPIPNNNPLPKNPTEKQFMIYWLKVQIKVLQNMLAELESTS